MTIIPVNPGIEIDSKILAASTWSFPLVGMVLGLLDLAVFMLLSPFVPSLILAAVLLTIPVVVTGGLHLDGLADTSDGIFSGRSRERMLEIMRDSRVGSLGVLALVIYMLLRWSSLSTVMGVDTGTNKFLLGLWIFVVPPIVARVAPVAAGLLCPYARKEGGWGQPYTEYVQPIHLIIAVITAMTALVVLAIASKRIDCLFTALLVSIISGLLFNRYIVKKLGGVTGDTLGALLEVTELFTLISISCVVSM